MYTSSGNGSHYGHCEEREEKNECIPSMEIWVSVAILRKTLQWFSKKLKMKLSLDAATPTLDTQQEGETDIPGWARRTRIRGWNGKEGKRVNRSDS